LRLCGLRARKPSTHYQVQKKNIQSFQIHFNKNRNRSRNFIPYCLKALHQ